MDLGLTDKTIIVTGGAKGIGSGITRGFAAVGARVAALDIDEEAGQASEAAGGRAAQRAGRHMVEKTRTENKHETIKRHVLFLPPKTKNKKSAVDRGT